MTSKADILFESRSNFIKADDELWEFMCELFEVEHEMIGIHKHYDYTKLPFEDLTYDMYDYSLELKKSPIHLRFTPEQLENLWDFGFLKIFVCHIDKSETYYTKGNPLGFHRDL